MNSWDDLRFFLAVARRGSLSRAAESLSVKPSTVHRRVGQLEDELQSRLFERHPRGYRLTAAGHALRDTAEQVEREVEAGRRRLSGHDASLGGVVRIAAAEDVATYLLVDVLRTVRREHPGIALEVIVGNERLSLTRGEADIAVRVGSDPDDDDVVPHRVGDVAAGLFASAAYRDARGRPRKPADLAGHALVLPTVLPPTLQPLGLEGEPAEVYRSNSFAHLGRVAAAGFGIALLPCFVAAQFPALVRLFAERDYFSAPMWLLVHYEVRRAARVKATLALLKTELADRLHALEGR